MLHKGCTCDKVAAIALNLESVIGSDDPSHLRLFPVGLSVGHFSLAFKVRSGT
ncbi:hypothetical protein RSAG8_07043, partial [Rhizoctonia solani AG-8 WAC10335]